MAILLQYRVSSTKDELPRSRCIEVRNWHHRCHQRADLERRPGFSPLLLQIFEGVQVRDDNKLYQEVNVMQHCPE